MRSADEFVKLTIEHFHCSSQRGVMNVEVVVHVADIGFFYNGIFSVKLQFAVNICYILSVLHILQ